MTADWWHAVCLMSNGKRAEVSDGALCELRLYVTVRNYYKKPKPASLRNPPKNIPAERLLAVSL